MSSIDPSQIPGLVTDAGYPVMLERYAQEQALRGEIFEVESITGTEQGMTGRVIVGADEPAVIAMGADSHARTVDEGYQWFSRVIKLAEHIVIREEEYRNPNASAILTGQIASASGRFGEGFQRKKEALAAEIFLYGSYTAGRLDVFDGSYAGHVDPYPKFIYDGKPFFAASGNGHPLFLDSATTKVNQDANALSAANLESARILMTRTNAVDEAGQLIRIDPNLLLVPPELEQSADVILGSTQAPGSANNDINVQRGRYRRLTWRFLTDIDAWFLGTAKRGVKLLDSGDPMISVSMPHPTTGDVTVRFTSYFGRCVTDWRYWTAHATSTS